MTDDPEPPPDPVEVERHRCLSGLKALNADLRRHGMEPLVSHRAAKTLDLDDLKAAVKVTGDYLIDTARKLKGL
jgi:hypothetical protein